MRAAVLLLLFLLFVPLFAHADYDAGLRAYEAGDPVAAFREWKAAAEQGDAKAQHRLGTLYREGLGVPQYFVAAHLYYNLAAAQGHAEARAARDALANEMSKEELAKARQLAVEWQPSDANGAAPVASTEFPAALEATSSALFAAAQLGDIAAIKRLLAAGVDVNSWNTGAGGWTALVIAAVSGHEDVVTTLLDAGADVDARSEGGATPLMAAALTGQSAVAEALISAGADTKAANASGVTALHIAKQKGHIEIAGLLAPKPAPTAKPKPIVKPEPTSSPEPEPPVPEARPETVALHSQSAPLPGVGPIVGGIRLSMTTEQVESVFRTGLVVVSRDPAAARTDYQKSLKFLGRKSVLTFNITDDELVSMTIYYARTRDIMSCTPLTGEARDYVVSQGMTAAPEVKRFAIEGAVVKQYEWLDETLEIILRQVNDEKFCATELILTRVSAAAQRR